MRLGERERGRGGLCWKEDVSVGREGSVFDKRRYEIMIYYIFVINTIRTKPKTIVRSFITTLAEGSFKE